MNKKDSEQKLQGSRIGIVSQIVDIVSQIVKKSRDELFLFVIAIVALLTVLVLLNFNLGSPNTRFIVAIIAILAFSAISGHFLLDVIRMRDKRTIERQKIQQVGYIELWKCSKCGYMNRWENWYCNKCTRKWEKSKDSHMWMCKKCNEYNLWANDFCSNCGKHYMMSPDAYST